MQNDRHREQTIYGVETIPVACSIKNSDLNKHKENQCEKQMRSKIKKL